MITMKTKLQSLLVFILACLFTVTGAAMNGDDKNHGRVTWLTKTTGTWKNKGMYGFYRATVIRQGGEHGKDIVSIEILERGRYGVYKTKKTITLDSPGYKGYVVDIAFNSIDEKRIAISIDIEMKAMYGIKMRDIYIISIDGDIQPVVSASWKDI